MLRDGWLDYIKLCFILLYLQAAVLAQSGRLSMSPADVRSDLLYHTECTVWSCHRTVVSAEALLPDT